MKKSIDGWGRRVTAAPIPVKAVNGLSAARHAVEQNLERARLTGKQALIETSLQALGLIKAALEFCQRANAEKGGI